MKSMDYLVCLVQEIHTTVVATVDAAGLPVTAALKNRLSAPVLPFAVENRYRKDIM